MRISVLTIGAIASIITTAAFANQVITSQTYVDNADARKVDIAQGAGDNNANVGKTLIVNSSGNLELGTVDVPTLPTGTANAVVTYDANGDIGGERNIFTNSYMAAAARDTFNDRIPLVSTVKGAAEYITDPTRHGNAPSDENDYRLIPVFNSALTGRFGALITTESLESGTWSTNSWLTKNVIPSLTAVNAGLATKQAQKVCVRYIDNAEQTDANCLLWNLP